MNKHPMLQKLNKLAQRTDLVIAVFLVAIIFAMILPLPTMVVDSLLGLNISASVVLLMVAVYISSPIEFVGFPSVLLLTTLARLALSITTTRLILLQGDAGQIVDTFGNFVVGGNLIVGLVIFLIITIVQFVVITKGSERVAEVSARFSLDGMPGRQMSIDSDMRAGLIDMNEARRLRQVLQKESQMYGAMDGAMKFVKGDAIAGLIIIVVNLLGGISIGMLQDDLEAVAALEKYSILTIGDGLVAQIPALLVSIAAGMIVTRVSTDKSQDLGGDLADQIMARPRAMLTGSALLALMSLVPGFPTFVFLSLAGAALMAGLAIQKKVQAQKEAGIDPNNPFGDPSKKNGEAGAAGAGPVATGKEQNFEISMPILVEISKESKSKFTVRKLEASGETIRNGLYHDLGVPCPPVQFRFVEGMEKDTYSIKLNEIPVTQGVLPDHVVLVKDHRDQMDIMNIPYQKANSGSVKDLVYWVEKSYVPQLKEMGIDFLQASEIISYHLSMVLKRYAHDFMGIQEAGFLMNKMEKQFAELVKEVNRLLPLQKIAEIFQRLVSEQISIRNMRTVLESLVEWAQKEKDVVQLTEYVRGDLKRWISHHYADSQNTLMAYLLTEDAEDVVRNAIRMTSAGAYLSLDPETSENFLNNLREAVGDLNKATHPPVMVVSMDVRRYVRKLIEGDFYDMPVLSFQELTGEVNVQPIKRVSLDLNSGGL